MVVRFEPILHLSVAIVDQSESESNAASYVRRKNSLYYWLGDIGLIMRAASPV